MERMTGLPKELRGGKKDHQSRVEESVCTGLFQWIWRTGMR